jgi:hypothetical protein
MTPPATRLGASVGELLDQAEETLYQLASKTTSASRLLAAWPMFAARSAGLIAEVAGRGYADLGVAARAASTDPLTAAGLHLRLTLAATKVSAARTLPDPGLTNVARLLAAATEIIEGAYARPGIAHREAAASDAARAAGITRVAVIVRAAADIAMRAAARSQSQRPEPKPTTRESVATRAARLSSVRLVAAGVLAVANGMEASTSQVRGPLDDIRVPTIELLDPTDLLGRFQVAVADWRRASLEATTRPAVSSAELLRATIEARHIIALNAAVTDSALASGLVAPDQGQRTLDHLQRAGTAWSRVTDIWTRFTTGVPPSPEHVEASLAVQASIRALTRDASGAWVNPSVLAGRVDIAAAMPIARAGLGDVRDIARAHEAALERIRTTGGLYAPAKSVELRPERVEARIRGHHVPVTQTELASVRGVYDVAATLTAVAHLGGYSNATTKASISAALPLMNPDTQVQQNSSRTTRSARL